MTLDERLSQYIATLSRADSRYAAAFAHHLVATDAATIDAATAEAEPARSIPPRRAACIRRAIIASAATA